MLARPSCTSISTSSPEAINPNPSTVPALRELCESGSRTRNSPRIGSVRRWKLPVERLFLCYGQPWQLGRRSAVLVPVFGFRFREAEWGGRLTAAAAQNPEHNRERFLRPHTCPLFPVHMGKTAFAFKCYLSLVAVVVVAPRWLRPCLACPSSLAIRMHHELLGPQTAADYGDDDADADDGGNSEF